MIDDRKFVEGSRDRDGFINKSRRFFISIDFLSAVDEFQKEIGEFFMFRWSCNDVTSKTSVGIARFAHLSISPPRHHFSISLPAEIASRHEKKSEQNEIVL
jgi:hypothetical protein